MSGAFASVYKINSSESPWAVRCFLNKRADHQERYKHISDFVLFDDLECTVPFYYLEEGIKIKGSWYPILKMEWVDGITLEKFLDENFNKKQMVLDLLKQFDEMILDLNRAGIAHGDLQHGNIIVTDTGLRLVDYDALYVPALEGWQSPEVGHPNFQHPDRSASNFNPGIDNFSAWLIHFSLLALSIDSELYRLAEGGDDSVLFKRSDFLDPRRSQLFRILVEHPATELRQAALMLAAMLAVEPSAIPPLNAGIDELCRLPDMSSLFLEDLDEEYKPIQSLDSNVENFSERVSKVLPENISRIRRMDGSELIVREAYYPAPPREEMHVKLALINRNLSTYIRTQANGWYLKRFPKQWCTRNLKRATSRFDQGHYQAAVPIYLELADVFELLINQRNFWKEAAVKVSFGVMMAVSVCFWYAIITVVACYGLGCRLDEFSLFGSLIGATWMTVLLYFGFKKLELERGGVFEPERLIVETHLSLGYCFCFTDQWRVASNFFTMALRGCKWGIDPELRKRALLLYAVCRNEGGERKEAIRFLVQKPEVIETLPSLVNAENHGQQLTKRLAAFEMFFELGQSYVHKRLVLSAVTPLLAAKAVYELLSKEDHARCGESAREMYLTLAYIYTIKSDWTKAQNMFNELILQCSLGNFKSQWQAEFCAALSSNLRGDVTGATALMMRSRFQPGELLNEIVDKDSVAHKILFYERSRGVAFLVELGARLKETNRLAHLMDICAILMYVFRCDVAPKPVFRITWLDELDEDFISECLRRSYFDCRQPTSNELAVLIDSAVTASLTKTVLILGQVMLTDNMLDKVDYLLNRMAALNQLNKLFLHDDIRIKERVDRFFVQVLDRMASDQLKGLVSWQSVAELDSRGAELSEESVKTLLDCIMGFGEGRSFSDVIYGAIDSPSMFRSECLQYRGILRFFELYLANRLAAHDKYEDSLILYDRLEGYYSANIDLVLEKAVSEWERIGCSDAEWIERAVVLSRLTSIYRSGAEGKYITRVRQLVLERARRHFASIPRISDWQTTVLSIDSFHRDSFVVIDTIYDTAIDLFRESVAKSAEPGWGRKGGAQPDSGQLHLSDRICQFILAVAPIYLEHDVSNRFLKHQAVMIEHLGLVSEHVSMRLRIVLSVLLVLSGADRDGSSILAGVVDSADLLALVLSTDPVVEVFLLRNPGADVIDLFVQAGDIERDDHQKARCFYLAAAFLYNALPLSTANRVLSQKLSARLGTSPGSESIESELTKFRTARERRKVSE